MLQTIMIIFKKLKKTFPKYSPIVTVVATINRRRCTIWKDVTGIWKIHFCEISFKIFKKLIKFNYVEFLRLEIYKNFPKMSFKSEDLRDFSGTGGYYFFFIHA